ncbi:MAG: hypothetical protein WCS94_08075 [Verrucomicrobiota bacterium]
MHEPLELIFWAVAISVSKIILSTLTDYNRWVKIIFDQKDKGKEG